MNQGGASCDARNFIYSLVLPLGYWCTGGTVGNRFDRCVSGVAAILEKRYSLIIWLVHPSRPRSRQVLARSWPDHLAPNNHPRFDKKLDERIPCLALFQGLSLRGIFLFCLLAIGGYAHIVGVTGTASPTSGRAPCRLSKNGVARLPVLNRSKNRVQYTYSLCTVAGCSCFSPSTDAAPRRNFSLFVFVKSS